MTLIKTVYDMLRFQMTGLSFLFVLLPLMLLAYYLFPPRMRPGVLLAESLLIYHFGGLGNLQVMLLSILVDYLLLRLMEYLDGDERKRRLLLWASIVKNLALIIWVGLLVQSRELPQQQIGLTIYTLSAIGCLFAAYRRDIPYERNIIRFALYCCFFPKLFAGPRHPYERYTEELGAAALRPDRMLSGGGSFIQGAFKTAIFGGSLYNLSQSAAALSNTALAAWLHVFSFAFAIYYMLSGYSDMALGIGAMFGLTLPRNFYYPYQARSVGDFFERYHMTIGDFLRGAVTSGLARDPNRRRADILGILLTGMLFGLWFGMRPSYLLWGLYLALFIVMERYLYPVLLENIPTLFSRIATLCVVLAGFTIFLCDTPLESVWLITTMFSFGNLFDNQVLYLLTSNWLLLLLSCFFATNIVNLAVVKLRRAAPVFAGALFGVLDIVILVLFLALSL